MITLPFVYFSNTLCSLKNIYHRISLYARASVTQGRNGMFSKQSAWKHQPELRRPVFWDFFWQAHKTDQTFWLKTKSPSNRQKKPISFKINDLFSNSIKRKESLFGRDRHKITKDKHPEIYQMRPKPPPHLIRHSILPLQRLTSFANFYFINYKSLNKP